MTFLLDFLDMTTLQVAKVFAENNYVEGKERIKATPDSIGKKNALAYEKTIEGAKVVFTLTYADNEYITTGGESVWDPQSMDMITSQTKWSDAKPSFISVSISGSKINGRRKDLFARIATALKSIGKVYKENENAVIVSLGNGQKGFIAYNNGRTIEMALINAEGFKGYAIDQFAKVEESNEPMESQEPQEQQESQEPQEGMIPEDGSVDPGVYNENFAEEEYGEF